MVTRRPGALRVWMNGEPIGLWTIERGAVHRFRYDASWPASPSVRPLSLSLPITASLELRGTVVEHWFDNLLPDSDDIRRRIAERFATDSTKPFDLLAAIGRDCVGAVQLLPAEAEPAVVRRIEGSRLDEASIARVLRGATGARVLGQAGEGDDFRISLAGAQEKTALLKLDGQWMQPHGSTPTTHILKLPLGVVGNLRVNLSDSVENEWLTMTLLERLGLPVAETAIEHFEDLKVLAVRRFDRRLLDQPRPWIARLPQEDLCQAAGLPPTARYESDGGPGIARVLEILNGSERSEHDRAVFLLTQFAFWMLGATDGHAKNFSIALRAGGGYTMTPLYDVLSAWPVCGNRVGQIPRQKLKLAMAVRTRDAHYRIDEIRARHWEAIAKQSRIEGLWDAMHAMAGRVPQALEEVTSRLPAEFPESVVAPIAKQTMAQARLVVGGAG